MPFIFLCNFTCFPPSCYEENANISLFISGAAHAVLKDATYTKDYFFEFISCSLV